MVYIPCGTNRFIWSIRFDRLWLNGMLSLHVNRLSNAMPCNIDNAVSCNSNQLQSWLGAKLTAYFDNIMINLCIWTEHHHIVSSSPTSNDRTYCIAVIRIFFFFVCIQSLSMVIGWIIFNRMQLLVVRKFSADILCGVTMTTCCFIHPYYAIA